MKATFHIDVGISVDSYVQAGEILDKITRDLAKTLDGKGQYDIGSFQARHTPLFADEKASRVMMAQSMPPDMEENYERGRE